MLFKAPPLEPIDFVVHQRIDALRKQLRHAVQAQRWHGLLSRAMVARAIQGSNSIEGYNVNDADAMAAVEGDEPHESTRETWVNIVGYRDAMTYVLQLADDIHFGFSPDLLRGLHYMMLRHDLAKHPGRYRPGPISVRNSATGERVYEAPDNAQVEDLVIELMEWMQNAENVPPLVRAAMGHLNLVLIHPFSDGNGRMSRCLQTLTLAREGILAPEFCSIEEYLGGHRQDYYDVLATVAEGSWQPERDTQPWVRFCLTAHHRQATRLLRRTREMETTLGVYGCSGSEEGIS